MTEAAAPPLTAIPPRFGRLKRWSAVGFTILLILAGLRWWWGYEAQRRLDAMVAQIHARGERITVADFQTDPIADEQNAAVPLEAAARAIKLTPAEDSWLNYFNYTLPIAPADRSALHGIVVAHAGQIAQARLARPLVQADFGAPVRSPVYTGLLRYLSDAYNLASVQLCGVLDAHLEGNDAEALELVRDLMHHIDMIAKSQPFLVTHDFATYRGVGAAEAVAQLAPELDLAGSSASTTRPATRDSVRLLIDELLDEEEVRKSCQLAWDGQRMMTLDAGPSLGSSPRATWMDELFAPMYVLDGLRSTAFVDQQRTAAMQPNYPGALKLAPRPPDRDGRSGLHSTVTGVEDHFSTSRGDRFVWQYRLLSYRRMAAIALAIRLYAVDHGRRLPPRLGDLVPTYLPALPVDPFRADGKTFGYRPDDKPPVLYSVGENGIDDGGAGAPPGWWPDGKTSSADERVLLTAATTRPS